MFFSGKQTWVPREEGIQVVLCMYIIHDLIIFAYFLLRDFTIGLKIVKWYKRFIARLPVCTTCSSLISMVEISFCCAERTNSLAPFV